MLTGFLIASAALTYMGTKVLHILEKTKKSPSALQDQSSVLCKRDAASIPTTALSIREKEKRLSIRADNDYLDKLLRRTANRDFIVSSVSLSLVVLGSLVSPLFTLAGIVGFAFVTIPVWQQAYYSLFKRKRINIYVLDSIAMPAAFLTGHIMAAAVAYWLYSISQKLLLKTQHASKKSLIGVFGEHPEFVWVLQDDLEIEVAFSALQVGDIVVVHAGEMIPVDGVISEGMASIDQHILTGESQPAEKCQGDKVFASTILLSGRVCIEVKQAGEDTVVAKIGEMLTSTIEYKSCVQTRGRQIADYVVLPTLLTSALALPVSGTTGMLAVMLSCIGDNVRLISPISMLNFLKTASNQGIFIKDGRAFELLAQVDTVVFDKTGTLTQEQPRIGKIHTLYQCDEDELLTYAAAAEHRQKHPIAKAITQAAQEKTLILPNIEDAEYEIGYGIKVTLSGQRIRVGSVRFMQMEKITIPEKLMKIIFDGQDEGYSFVLVAIDHRVIGAIELHPTIRPEAELIIKDLKARNKSLYIISGDNEKPTQRLAERLGIDHYFANTLPENKAKLIQQLMDEGKFVCFIGDGINDSIALKQAHVSISLKGASTVATDTAQIILMDGSLKYLSQLFSLVDEFNKNMNTGLTATIIPGLLTISGVFLLHWGVASAIVLYNIGLVGGVTNAMLPLIRQRSRYLPK